MFPNVILRWRVHLVSKRAYIQIPTTITSPVGYFLSKGQTGNNSTWSFKFNQLLKCTVWLRKVCIMQKKKKKSVFLASAFSSGSGGSVGFLHRGFRRCLRGRWQEKPREHPPPFLCCTSMRPSLSYLTDGIREDSGYCFFLRNKSSAN